MTLAEVQAASPAPGLVKVAGQVIRVNSAMLIMGPTGSGKSSLLATLAEWMYQTHGKITRLVTTDGGGFPTRVQGLMQKGIMEVWRARTRDLPDGSLSFETCLRATQGWWPKRLNARTGECPPGVELVPPITERYEMRCPQDHLLKVVPFQSLLTPQMCPICKLHVSKENMRVAKTSGQTKGFEHVGLVCFDGLTSMLSWMLSDMGQRSGRLELKGEEGAIGGKIISGNLKMGGNTRSHIGFAQSRAEELALNSLAIPYLLHPPVFTALTDEATDEGGLSIKGPKLAGHARTADGPSWFGDCLEAAVIKNDRDQRVYRLYLAEYVDEAGCRHLCKNRADPGSLPPFLEDPPIDGNEAETAFSNFNLGLFRQLEDKALERTMTLLDQRYPDAPGVAEGWVEVGETGTSQPSAETSPAQEAAHTPTSQPAPSSGPAQPTKPGVAPKAPPAPRAPQGKAPVGRPVVGKPAPPAPATPPSGEPAPATEQPPVTAIPAAAPAPAQAPPVAAKPAPVGQATNSPATVKQWAPPGAPRPPAPAPRLKPQASSSK